MRADAPLYRAKLRWDRHLPSFRADDGHAHCYLCHCGDCAHDERGAATSDRARFQRRQASHPDGVRGRSSHGRRCWGRAKRAADVRRRPEIDRETPCRCRCPAPSAEDRSEKPVDRISGRRHLRGRHPAHRSRCRPGIFAEQPQDGDQAEIGIQQALSRPPDDCDATDGRRSFVGALAVFASWPSLHRTGAEGRSMSAAQASNSRTHRGSSSAQALTPKADFHGSVKRDPRPTRSYRHTDIGPR